MSSWIIIHENSAVEILLSLISNKRIGIITGKLNTLIKIELFLIWWPTAEIKVRQLEILNEPKNNSVKKNDNELITLPIRKVKIINVRRQTSNIKMKLYMSLEKISSSELRM